MTGPSADAAWGGTRLTDVKVGIDFGGGPEPLGRLGLGSGGIHVEYDGGFLDRGVEISPLRLPAKPGLIRPDGRNPFEDRMPGVFYDSLPDAWGHRLLNRLVRGRGGHPDLLTPLDRLAHVGAGGMGALVYEPDIGIPAGDGAPDLDTLSVEAERVLAGEESEVLDELAAAGASLGGAQPKALVAVDGAGGGLVRPGRHMPPGQTAWMVKFPTNRSGMDAGAMEFAYARMALDAGVEMAETRLFGTELGHAGYFGTELFDRRQGERLHLLSVCGLLHSPFEVPALDYEDLVRLTFALTRKDIREVEKLFRIAVFNVLASNRDDHSKNFAFLMDREGRWRLAPAYDLTYTIGPSGEHKMSVSGVGRNPGRKDLERLGAMASLDGPLVAGIIDQTLESVSRWTETAKECGVGRNTIKEVADGLGSVRMGFDG